MLKLPVFKIMILSEHENEQQHKFRYFEGDITQPALRITDDPGSAVYFVIPSIYSMYFQFSVL